MRFTQSKGEPLEEAGSGVDGGSTDLERRTHGWNVFLFDQ